MFKQEIAMLSCFSFRSFSPKTNGIFSLPELGWPRGIGSLEHARLQQQGGRSEEFRKTSLDGFEKHYMEYWTILNICFMIPSMFCVCLCPSLFSIFVKCAVPKCVHLPSDKSIPWTSSQEPSSGAKPPPHIRSFSWIKEDSKYTYIHYYTVYIVSSKKRSRGFKVSLWLAWLDHIWLNLSGDPGSERYGRRDAQRGPPSWDDLHKQKDAGKIR